MSRRTNRHGDLEASPFGDKPVYRYIRKSDRLPTLDEARRIDLKDLKATVKVFNPWHSWVYYIAAYDEATRTAYGAVDGFEFEVGPFEMSVITDNLIAPGRVFPVDGPHPIRALPWERDLYWTPKSLEALLRAH